MQLNIKFILNHFGLTILFLLFSCFFIFSQDTLTLQPNPQDGFDAEIWSLDPLENYGDLVKSRANAWTWGSSFGIQRSFYKFDLSDLPEDASLISAKLSLYYHRISQGIEQTHFGENQCKIQRIIEPWDEFEINWNNQPDVSDDNLVLIPQSVDPRQDYPDIDVTNLYLDILESNENFGISLRLSVEQEYRRMCFASSDIDNSQLRPKLELIYQVEDCDSTIADFLFYVSDFSVSFSDASVFAETWFWDFGDGFTSDIQNPIHNFVEAGDYIVCLITENYCSSDEICKLVNLSCDTTIADFTYSILNNTINFQDQSTNVESWSWDFGDGNQSNEQNPSHTYDLFGEYDVCLTTSNYCSNDQYCKMITIECDSTEANFLFYVDSNKVFFSDQSVYAETWFWSFGDGYFSNLQSPAHFYEEPNTYWVCLTTTNDCSQDLYCDSVQVDFINCDFTQADFQYSIVDDIVYFYFTGEFAEEYFWDFNNGLYSFNKNPFINYTESGAYQVCLYTENSCSDDWFCDTVFYNKIPCNECDGLCITLYPNPTRGLVYIEYHNIVVENLYVYDVYGRKIFSLELPSDIYNNKFHINLDGFASGLYTFEILSGEYIFKEKLIKK